MRSTSLFVPRAALRAVGLLAVLTAFPATAVDLQGVVEFQGHVSFAAPIAGIPPDQIELAVGTTTDATGNGERCSILSVTGGLADVTGVYPSTGAVTAEILLERGGNQLPDGECLVTIRAWGFDGSSATARGSVTLLVPAADVGAGNVVAVPEILVRESHAVAGIDDDCKKWVKKQLKLRDKCNGLILKKGPEAAVAKCKDSGPAPAACDPGLHAEAILVTAHGMNDQQVDPAEGQTVDLDVLGDHVKCQKRFGKAAAKFTTKRVSLVQQRCIKSGVDSRACRDEQSQAARSKLDQIDKCPVDPLVDGATGRVVPDVGTPCEPCMAGGTMDRKCLKACFQSALGELTDGILGDVPVCGDGVLQGGEFCDDGNTQNGDGCSSLCGIEAG